MSIIRNTGAALIAAAALALTASCTREAQTPETGASPAAAPGAASGEGFKIAMMPKVVGIEYFNAVKSGAEEAAKEQGGTLTWDGPVNADVTKQIEMLDAWIARRPNVIAVSANDPNALAPTLKKARERGIVVLTYDSDSTPDSRDYFVNQATAESIGYTLVDEMAEQIGGEGEVAIVTGSLTATNQNIWMEWMRKRIAEKFPNMKIVDLKPSGEDQQLAVQVTQDLLKAYPDLKGIFAITSVAFPGAAQAVKQAGKSGQVAVVGLATPNAMKPYVEDGTVKTVILWNPVDLGYLTVQAGRQLLSGDRKLTETLTAGRLGDVQVSGTEILLGPPMKFTKENIDQFNF